MGIVLAAGVSCFLIDPVVFTEDFGTEFCDFWIVFDELLAVVDMVVVMVVFAVCAKP